MVVIGSIGKQGSAKAYRASTFNFPGIEPTQYVALEFNEGCLGGYNVTMSITSDHARLLLAQLEAALRNEANTTEVTE